MGTIADKLNYLNETKEDIKNALVEKGVTITENDTFRDYAGKINEISGASQKASKLEYIQMVGSMCFDTGYIHKSNTDVEAKFYIPTTTRTASAWTMLFGARKDSYQNNAFAYFLCFNGQKKFAFCRTGNETTGIGIYDSDLLLTTSGKVASITQISNGNRYKITTTGKLDAGANNMLIGAINCSPTDSILLDISSSDGLKIYYFKILEDGVVVKDYVPYRNEKGEIGLLEQISNTFIPPFNGFITGADID